ncbi:MAG: helix-turn-helix domain-containing protein [Ruminococcus flavefaciens]|nr:helix-turn-helix domain-containing protein [Ruminococcus flavefaciens]MCM1062087.1 helix-turn-helix domain-containing protein [Eubacterium sp.]
MEIKNTFSKKLIELRKSNNLTKKELAERLEISAASLGYYESGERLPDISTACKIADFFNITCDELIRGIKAENVNINKKLGLSDQAVSMLSDRGILTYPSIEKHDADLYAETLNEILSNSEFYNLVYNCTKLKELSNILDSNGYFLISDICKADINKCDYKLIDELFVSNSQNTKYSQYYNECDICRYLNIKAAENLSDIFDYRKRAPDFIINYIKERKENAEHNPTKE